MALSAAQKAQQDKIIGDLGTLATGLRSDIQALKDAIAANTGTPAVDDPDVTAAFNAIAARLAPLQALDAENGGQPPVPPIDEV